MEINLSELITTQNALVNVKMSLSGETKLDQDKLAILVNEAYAVVMKKIDSLGQPFLLNFAKLIGKILPRGGSVFSD